MNLLTHEQLIIGHWYSLNGRPPFELVAMDESDRSLDVQYYDGTIAELEATTTLLSGLSRSASPVDVSGAIDGEMESVGAPMQRDGKWSDGLLDQLDREALNSDIASLGTGGALDVWNKEWA